MLEHQRSVAETPDAAELERTIVFENTGQPNIDDLVKGLQAVTQRSAESSRHR